MVFHNSVQERRDPRDRLPASAPAAPASFQGSDVLPRRGPGELRVLLHEAKKWPNIPLQEQFHRGGVTGCQKYFNTP